MIINTLEKRIQRFYKKIDGYTYNQSLIVVYTEIKSIALLIPVYAQELQEIGISADRAILCSQKINIYTEYLQFLSHYIIDARDL